MLINELPDDCLRTIFDYMQGLEDLINCFKVCEKWSNVIVGRTKRVKYLFNQSFSPDYALNFVKRPIDITCLSKLFPNLRIAYFSGLLLKKSPIEDIAKVIRDSKYLKGIMIDTNCGFELMPEIANFEMLSIGFVNPNISGIYENVKQLHFWESNLYLFELVYYFPNLERLKFYKQPESSEPYYDAPVLANLKILEMERPHIDWKDAWCSFVFMDSCPALQSAHIRIRCFPIGVNYSIKLANLQDLVIEFYESIEWNDLRRQMSKYPNLKHLAIRATYLQHVREENIKELVLILPKLTLLDVRKSYGITQEGADHVRNYCKQHGRSIKFYFNRDDEQIKSDWPQLLNHPFKICRGFDFMENCFFKSFDDLPHFLDPIDD
ncbi:uncharacterized protein LOC112539765 [Tetranychus urticae]|uniref:uncharacterized protein LOC112539765 n=1 Tax=Tetranychus urticae TaxID=32264 RepID=UPI000D651519|nr:uncharacterized protein LOC112539765 [Tetranychus urticae]